MAEANLTMNADIKTSAREIDFVSRFAKNWTALQEIMGIMRPIKKAPGTTLKSTVAAITLETGAIAEGENIPYSKATVEEIPYGNIAVEKFKKGTTIEAIKDKGYDNAVAKTDQALLNALQASVMNRFYAYLLTGQLRGSYTTFQMAMAMSKGLVLEAFRAMQLDATEVVGFANILDVYEYLGGAEISTQTAFGVTYVKDFLGFRVVILGSSNEIPRGKVVAVPVENIDLYYVDPSESEFAMAGLEYTVDGETPLIGFHSEGNYDNATSNVYAIMGLTLFSEYINGIAVVDFGASIPDNDLALDFSISAATDLLGKVVGDLQKDMSVANGNISGTLKHVTGYTGFSGEPFNQSGHYIAIHATAASGATITAELVGGAGGAVTLDADGIDILKVGSNSEVIRLVATLSGVSETKLFNLSDVVLE